MALRHFVLVLCFISIFVFHHCVLSLLVCFKVFDVDRDGILSRDELHEMVVALLEVWKDNRTDTLPVSSHTHTHSI